MAAIVAKTFVCHPEFDSFQISDINECNFFVYIV